VSLVLLLRGLSPLGLAFALLAVALNGLFAFLLRAGVTAAATTGRATAAVGAFGRERDWG
jgi:hypothetical protein